MPNQTGKPDLPPDIQASLQQVRDLGEQFQRNNDLRFLDQAIDTYETILKGSNFRQLDAPHRMFLLDSIGELYGTRARATGRESDFERSLMLRRDAVLLMPRQWQGADDLLHNMAFEYWKRYERSRNLQHLEEYARLAWQLPRSHHYAPVHLNDLGVEWMRRYDDRRSLMFLNQAIRCFDEASKISPAGARARRALTHLIMARRTLYLHSQDKADLDRYRDAVMRLPSSDADRASHLTEHGRLVFQLYEMTGDISLLEEAVQSHEAAWRWQPHCLRHRKGKDRASGPVLGLIACDRQSMTTRRPSGDAAISQTSARY
jgi:tetratricopeptide (TPR) repeat protein